MKNVVVLDDTIWFPKNVLLDNRLYGALWKELGIERDDVFAIHGKECKSGGVYIAVFLYDDRRFNCFLPHAYFIEVESNNVFVGFSEFDDSGIDSDHGCWMQG